MPVADHLAEFKAAVDTARGLLITVNGVAPPVPANQIGFLLESSFLSVFRAYENLIELTFLDYLAGEPTASGVVVASYVSPRDRGHARSVVQDMQSVLDWANPENVTRRADIYFVAGGPIKVAVAGSYQYLLQARKIRNHVAHNSVESHVGYSAVVNTIFTTPPAVIPSVGEFLNSMPAAGPAKRRVVFDYFIEKLSLCADACIA